MQYNVIGGVKMSERNWRFGDPEWRFLSGKTFDLTVTKLRCRGYPVMRGGNEIAFIGQRNGEWYVLSPSGREPLKPFPTRQAALDSLDL